MKALAWLAITCIALCAACTPVVQQSAVAFHVKEGPFKGDTESRAALIGRWFSESVAPNGERRLELKELRRDGTYQVTFRSIQPNGHFAEQTEVGVWGVSGRVYFTIMQGYLAGGSITPVSREDPSYYDAYDILRLDGAELELRLPALNVRYLARRVPPSFRLPDIL